MNQRKTAKDGIIYWAVFLIPVVWAALIVAPCLGGNLADIISKFTEAMAIIVQNLAQLKGLYKEHGWETITGNCDTLLYLGGNEQSTHEYISKLLGKETIDTRTHGQTKGRSGSYSTNMQITGRELLTPDEVRVLDNKNALLFVRGFPAIMDKKYDLESHPNNKKTKNGGYPPYIHKEDIFRGIPFAEAFDFANAEDYEYFEGDE